MFCPAKLPPIGSGCIQRQRLSSRQDRAAAPVPGVPYLLKHRHHNLKHARAQAHQQLLRQDINRTNQ
ncbi:hypothetical protein FJTKL_12617 [Diaporthe vaccinii]|uniref:Uncharacterized protein n=1 Tax=Diaporthe vaccinii TaxID=105482 RepID=A0ABR4ED85_9PEZI